MKFKKKILKNGLRAIVAPMKDSPTVTALILVETGSKYETKKINGLSHFLEHMCFKGTIKRRNSQMISTELDALGTNYNAFTGQEYTGYYVKGDTKNFKKIFDIVADIYLNSIFPEAEMEREKGVIIEEINMYEDMPQQHVQDMMMELLYGNQPAGWNIAGPRENIRKMKRQDFIKYHKGHYVPQATTVIVAGGIKEESAFNEIKNIFGDIKKRPKTKKLKVVERQSAPKIMWQERKTDQSHIVFGFRTQNLFDKRNPAIRVLSAILGAGMSSRLFHKMREELGVCYYISASNNAFTDHGFLDISVGVTNGRVLEVVSEILKECKRLTQNLVSEKELQKVKQFIIGNSKMSLESSDEIANFLGGQEILKKEIDLPDVKFGEIENVSDKDIIKIAKEIFQNKNLNLAGIGPKQDSKKLKNTLKI